MPDVKAILESPMDDPTLVPRFRAAVEDDGFDSAMAIINGEMTDDDRMRLSYLLLQACPPAERVDLLAAFNVRAPGAQLH